MPGPSGPVVFLGRQQAEARARPRLNRTDVAAAFGADPEVVGNNSHAAPGAVLRCK